MELMHSEFFNSLDCRTRLYCIVNYRFMHLSHKSLLYALRNRNFSVFFRIVSEKMSTIQLLYNINMTLAYYFYWTVRLHTDFSEINIAWSQDGCGKNLTFKRWMIINSHLTLTVIIIQHYCMETINRLLSFFRFVKISLTN